MPGIAPPTFENVETPTTHVEHVILPDTPEELPAELQNINKAVTQPTTPQERLKVGQDINRITSETKDYHPNMQPQWGGVISSLLSRDYKGALKYYNGGPITEELAKDVTGKQYYKSYNQIGEIGVIKDAITGKELSSKEKQDLMNKGGVISKSDEQALKNISWKNAEANAEMARLGIATAPANAFKNAYNASQVASNANNNIEEQIALTKKLDPVINNISKLSPLERSKVLSAVATYNSLSKNTGQQAEKALGANASKNEQQGSSFSGGLGLGKGEGLGGNLGGGVSDTLGTNIGANARATSGLSSSAGTNEQLQSNAEKNMLGVLSQYMKPEQVRDFLRLQSLNNANQDDYKSIPTEVQPPGWESVPETDVLAGGSKSIIANRVTQQKNNALMAAWSKELLKSAREEAKTGQSVDMDELKAKFANSDTYKAITNTFYGKLHKHLTGEELPLESGSLFVDQQNRIHKVK